MSNIKKYNVFFRGHETNEKSGLQQHKLHEGRALGKI
ncbi:hypothetical protein GA0116948_102119 [Chitinophaga costaii]|uniref:Uncharacterized protein n=1 Tax=Chitinophaga costaii TaxID=1335309 RepID=A0A1C4AGA2_9BACT|nr:hypothetical protein GA0116948_102119 [Chitinophaga costaii]